MSKYILITILCLSLIVVGSFSLFSKSSPTTTSTLTFEESICEKLAAQYGDCKRVIFIDKKSNLVFAENDSEIMPVLVNKEFTEVIKLIHPLEFQEYKEEYEPISWQADNKLLKNFSMVSGFASDDAKSIIINSVGGIQPNRFYIGDNLWFWYVTFPKDEVILPVDVTAYDENGQIIYGGDEEE